MANGFVGLVSEINTITSIAVYKIEVILQDQLMECMTLLQEAVNILRVEPHMRTELEAKVKELSSQLDITIDEADCISVD